ncbi:MAG TPA: hypothetical protein VLY85_00390 [Thermoplasmata archaeon]|nr:hypothetical protein [Thermoplasmata archaeon]
MGSCQKCGAPASLRCASCGRTFCRDCLDADERLCGECLQMLRRKRPMSDLRPPPSRLARPR